ncbi:MAG: lactonase family protein [Verrucomicrobiae bacterium]|jgi:6-phosphogluconolactonase|nr:lactonase family protein [Verrucomicrobiae bacterium]
MKSIFRPAALIALSLCALLLGACKALESAGANSTQSTALGTTRVYVGTYTKRDSRGIYAFDLDLKTGALSPKGIVAESENPSFLALHPNGKTLYAANEVSRFNDAPGGAVSAFSINSETGALTLLGQQATGGAGPCHVSVDQAGQNLLVANYGGGSVACFPINVSGVISKATGFVQHTGSSVNPRRQKEPHAHSINVSPDNRFAIAADLGIDKLLVYRFNPNNGSLGPNEPAFTRLAPGAGPRHFAFHPSGRFAYVINELHCTVTAFVYDAEKGTLTERQTISTLDVPLQKGFSTAEVQVHPSGRFLYGSNRGHDSIAVFEINAGSGTLQRIQVASSGGTTPRNFGIDPTGNYLITANQNSDNLVVHRINQQSGRLTPTGNEAPVPSPVCVKFLPLD